MDNVDRLVRRWVQEGLLPGAALEVTVRGQVALSECYGAYDDGTATRRVTPETLFDLASLTKVTATLPSALLLAADGRLALDDPVSAHLPPFRHPQVTVRHLLLHASGLPPDLPYAPRSAARPGLLADIYALPLGYPPGEDMRYSDLGLILLGRLVERIAGEPLDRFAARQIFAPLGMTGAMFNPAPALRERIAATERVDGRYLVGEVHDEKSFRLGGVSGSAGLFATARDLTRYAAWWLRPEAQPLVPPPLLRAATAQPIRGRGLGWEVWHEAERVPACGASWPVGSFGHTGFTGTSLWLAPEQEVSVVFLTNAVHLGRNNRIRELRPVLHETVWSSLFSRG